MGCGFLLYDCAVQTVHDKNDFVDMGYWLLPYKKEPKTSDLSALCYLIVRVAHQAALTVRKLLILRFRLDLTAAEGYAIISGDFCIEERRT